MIIFRERNMLAMEVTAVEAWSLSVVVVDAGV